MFRSDLAVEFSKQLVGKKDYLKSHVKINDNITKTIIQIISDNAVKKFGRERGLYYSFDIPFDPIILSLERDNLVNELVLAIKDILNYIELNTVKSALIVGLGNDKMTADCFGDKVINNIMVTRHATKSGMDIDDICEVSAFSCGVFGVTGFESYDAIKGIVDAVNPDVVFLIDTLISSSSKRLCANIQIANVGIIPGSGVGNARKEISAKTLHTKVITVGMPLAIYATSLLTEVSKSTKLKFSKKIKDLVMMPREIDEQIKINAKILASAINKALNPNFSKENFETFFV